MEIYDLCGNDGLASGVYRLEFIGWNLSVGIYRLEFIGWNLSVGIYRCRAARAVKILKFTSFDPTHCAAAEILSRIGRRLGAAMETACALRAALAAWGRERRGRLCGACCGGSSEDRVQ